MGVNRGEPGDSGCDAADQVPPFADPLQPRFTTACGVDQNRRRQADRNQC